MRLNGDLTAYAATALGKQPSPVIDPVRKMWLGVLAQGIRDCLGLEVGSSGERRHRRAIVAEARMWLEDPREFVGSFAWLCETLNLNATSLRKQVYKAMADPLAKRKTLSRRLQVTRAG